MTYPSITATTDDTPDARFAKPKKPPISLRKIFGKVAACIAVAATIAFYSLGFTIGHAYYEQWQDNKASVTQSWDAHASQHDKTENLPWALAGGALALSYGAGFTGIALGRKKQSSSYSGGSSYDSGYRSNDNFWWGYWMGSSSGRSGGSSSSSSSSNDKGGAAAALVIVGAAALAAGATVVSYKAVKANFTGEEPEPEEETNPLSITPRRPSGGRVLAP